MQDNRKNSGMMGSVVSKVRKPRTFHMMMAFIFALSSLFSASAYSASKTVLVLGDSLSAEYGLARGAGWVTLLEKQLATEKVDATIVNASISGETTSGGRTRLQTLLTQHRPSVIVIELGANDALRGLPVPSTEANLTDMISSSKQAGAKVLLVGMQIPPNYGRDYAQQFAGMYAKIAKVQKIALVPFFLENVANDDNLFQSDRIHPTSAAQPIMLKNVWPHLKPLLGK